MKRLLSISLAGVTKQRNQSSYVKNKVVPCKFDGGVGGQKGKVGVVLLSGDQTLEKDLCSVLHPLEVGCFFSRVEMVNEVTPETLQSMRMRIGGSASLILPESKLDVLAYGCTSAAATIGEEKVFEQLSKRDASAFKTTPVTAALEAFKASDARKIGLVTPYIGEVNEILIKYIEGKGPWRVTNLSSFNLIRDADVASVTKNSIVEAATQMGANDDVDTVFISCTNLRTSDIITDIEKVTGKLTTSSNMSMAWHIVRLLGIKDDLSGSYGKLFSR